MPFQPTEHGSELERDLRQLEEDMRRLEREYNMYFAGSLPKPPWDTRGRVYALIKRYSDAYIPTYADRFRFNTMASRFAMFSELWERGLRAREEGRPGPFSWTRKPKAAAEKAAEDRVLHVTAFRDPLKELDKLHELYERLVEARRDVGDEAVPFHKFAELVKQQVKMLQKAGSPEVAFRVAVKDGKVNFTARGLKGAKKA